MDTNAKNTGQYIADLRKGKDLTQQQLADLLGVTNKAVSKWENGQGLPDIGILLQLADTLGVSTDELLQGRGADSGIQGAGTQDAGMQEPAPPAGPPAAEPRRHTAPKRIVGILLSVFGSLGLITQILYFTAGRRLGLVYEIACFEQIANVIVALLLAAGILVLLGARPSRKTAQSLLIVSAAAIFVYLAAAIPLFGAHAVSIIRYSPDHQNKLVLRYDTGTGKTALLKQGILWFAQCRDIFPFTASEGDFKIQWLVDDVCAVTYMSDDDGSIHQYVATYGARGDQAGYTSPYSVVASLGWRTELSGAVWSIETSQDGIGIRQGTETTIYSWQDCVPFGTTAVVLCKDGVPEWTIALNEDCFVEYGYVRGGCSITLCRVSMEKTAAFVFQSTNPA